MSLRVLSPTTVIAAARRHPRCAGHYSGVIERLWFGGCSNVPLVWSGACYTVKVMPRPPKTKAAATPKAKAAPAEPRVIKAPKYRSFKLQKRIKPVDSVPGGVRLLRTAISTMARHWKLFLGLIVVYTVLSVILVQGFSTGGDVSSAKKSLEDVYHGGFTASLLSGLALFTYVLGNAGKNVTPAAEGYQLVLALLMSVVFIWALREAFAGHKVGVRDAFYRGAYPLVPFFLVLCVIGLQLLPLAGGAILFGTVTSGIAATWLETALWGVIACILGLASLYMVSSSVFGLYVACLPNTAPVKALRTARNLVVGRRFLVLRRLLFLPLALLVLAAVIVVPVILVAAPAAGWVFFVLSMAGLALVHAYIYALYRSLL